MEEPAASPLPLTEFERGVVVGVLIGEGSFGGDGKQPQVALRLHVRHERLLRWLAACFPRSKLYGPYNHGGREYFQWMARGSALAVDLMPLLEQAATLDGHAEARVAEMRSRYGAFIEREQARGSRDA